MDLLTQMLCEVESGEGMMLIAGTSEYEIYQTLPKIVQDAARDKFKVSISEK